MAQRRGFHPQRGVRRKTDWGLGPEDVDGNLSASGSSLWSGSVILVDESEVTLVRVRGLMHMLLIATSTVGTGFFGASGLMLVTNEAFAVGITAMPLPLTDEAFDGWLWHHYWDVRAVSATIGDGGHAAAISQRVVIDSKAMRVWDSGHTLVGVHEVVESVAGQVEIQASSRTLVKLP